MSLRIIPCPQCAGSGSESGPTVPGFACPRCGGAAGRVPAADGGAGGVRATVVIKDAGVVVRQEQVEIRPGDFTVTVDLTGTGSVDIDVGVWSDGNNGTIGTKKRPLHLRLVKGDEVPGLPPRNWFAGMRRLFGRR